MATVLTKWTITALRLRPFAAQKGLRVKVRVSDSNPKEIHHTCFLEDEDTGNVAAFSIDSPGPVAARCVEPADEPVSPDVPVPQPQSEFDDLEGIDQAFLAEIDELAEREELASIPTSFYTPRVFTMGVPVVDNEGAHRRVPRKLSLPSLQLFEQFCN